MSRTSPKTPINRAISSERSFAGISLSLAISSGALRRYLIAENALPTTSMTAFVPISLCKPGDTTQENQVMAMISSLASDIEDPKARHVAIAVDAKRSEKLINPLRTMMPLWSAHDALCSGRRIATSLSDLDRRARPPSQHHRFELSRRTRSCRSRRHDSRRRTVIRSRGRELSGIDSKGSQGTVRVRVRGRSCRGHHEQRRRHMHGCR